MIGDHTYADAILNHLVQNDHRVELTGKVRAAPAESKRKPLDQQSPYRQVVTLADTQGPGRDYSVIGSGFVRINIPVIEDPVAPGTEPEGGIAGCRR